jgi:hypothetical protein
MMTFTTYVMVLSNNSFHRLFSSCLAPTKDLDGVWYLSDVQTRYVHGVGLYQDITFEPRVTIRR